jgi:hypothetical protein
MTKPTHGRTASGKVITEPLVEDLAARAEQGYDIDRTLKRRAGRPPIGAGPAVVESVRLDPELRAALRARARRSHESTSAIIRKALRAYLKSGQ